MINARKFALAALAAAILAGCAPAHAKGAPAVADVNAVGERFVRYFRERCALPIRAGDAPVTAGLAPASASIVARFPKAPDHQELSGRALSYWMAPDDPEGSAILVIEAGADGERCAAVTEAFSAAAFARLLKKTYPQYLGESSDEKVLNARAFLEDAGAATRSVVYSSYHDPKMRVSAGVVSLSEAD